MSAALGALICTETTADAAQNSGPEKEGAGQGLIRGPPEAGRLFDPDEDPPFRAPSSGSSSLHLSDGPPPFFPTSPHPTMRFPNLSEDPEFWAGYRRRCDSTPNFVVDFLEELLSIPEAILACAAGSIQQGCRSHPPVIRWVKGEPQAISDRFLEFSRKRSEDGPLASFTRNLAERESRFFAGLAGSELYTHEIEDGNDELDEHDLLRKQRKILWDVLRKTYVESYRQKTEKTIRDDSLEVREWMGADFVVLPPMIAGYVYFRGLEKDVSIGPTRLSFSFESLKDWLSGDELWGAMDFECALKGFPIGLVVSVGLHDDDLKLDFIGIGTSIGAVRKAVTLQQRRIRD